MCKFGVDAFARSASVFLVTTMLAGCLATLPDPVYTNDADVFKKDDTTYKCTGLCVALSRSSPQRQQ